MGIEDDIAFIERVPTLRMLGRTALRILAIGAESRYVHQGEVLFNAGDATDCGFVIMDGSFSLKSASNAVGEVVAGPGTLLGELALIAETKRPGDRDCARALDRDPHLAQPVPEDAGRLSRRRASPAPADYRASAAVAKRNARRARPARCERSAKVTSSCDVAEERLDLTMQVVDGAFDQSEAEERSLRMNALQWPLR